MVRRIGLVLLAFAMVAGSTLGAIPVGAQALRAVNIELSSPATEGPHDVEDLLYLNGALTAEGAEDPGGGGDPGDPTNQLPIAGITAVLSGATATFTFTATDPDGAIAHYEFDAGDGSDPVEANSAPPSSRVHTYGAEGTFLARLTITDDKGAIDSATTSVTVDLPDGGGGSGTVLFFHRGLTGEYAADVLVDASTPSMDTASPTEDVPAVSVDVAVLLGAGARTPYDASFRSTSLHQLAAEDVTAYWWVLNPTTPVATSTYDIALYEYDGSTYTALYPVTRVNFLAMGDPGEVVMFEHQFGQITTSAARQLLVQIGPVFINFGQESVFLYDSIDYPSCLVIAEGSCLDEGADPPPDPDPDPDPDPEPDPGSNETEISGIILLPAPMGALYPVPGMVHPALNGITNYAIHLIDVDGGESFSAVAGGALLVSDYDVCFYGDGFPATGDEAPLSCAAVEGDEYGSLPAGAEWALVMNWVADSPQDGFTFSVEDAFVEEPPGIAGDGPVPMVTWPEKPRIPGIAPMIDPPSEAPDDAEMQDDTGDSWANWLFGGQPPMPIDHMDIEAVWFDQDDEGLYVGMKLVGLTAQPVTLNTIYGVNFIPSWYEPTVPENYLFSTFTAGFQPANFNDPGQIDPIFSLQQTYFDEGTGFNTIQVDTSLPGSSFDYENDIIWWVVPFDVINDPTEGDALESLNADTGLDAGLLYFPGIDTVSTPAPFTIGGGTPPPPPPPPVPVVSIPGGPYSGTVNQPITITGSQTGISGAPQCLWTGPAQASFASANSCVTAVTFNTANTAPGYTINLRVTDPADSSRTDIKPTTVLVAAEGEEEPDPDPVGGEPITGSIEVRSGSCTGNVIMTHTVYGEDGYYPFSFYADLYSLPEGRHSISLCYRGDGFAPATITRVIDLTKNDRSGPQTVSEAVPKMTAELSGSVYSINPGDSAPFTLTVSNPGKVAQTFTARAQSTPGWTASPATITESIPAKSTRTYAYLLRSNEPGTGTLDVVFGQDGGEQVFSQSVVARAPGAPWTVNVVQIAPAGNGAFQISLDVANARDLALTVSGTLESAGARVPFRADLAPYGRETLTLRLVVPASANAFDVVAAAGGDPIRQPYPLPPMAPARTDDDSQTPGAPRRHNVLIEAGAPERRGEQLAIQGRLLIDGLPARGKTLNAQVDGKPVAALATDDLGRFTLLVPSTASTATLEAEGVQRVILVDAASILGTEAKNASSPSLFAVFVLLGVCLAIAVRRRVE